MVKILPVVQETRVPPLGQEDPLEKEMATHSSTLAWRIPWTEEPGGLQSMGSQRVGHDCPTNTFTSLESKGRHVTQCLLKEGTDKAEMVWFSNRSSRPPSSRQFPQFVFSGNM